MESDKQCVAEQGALTLSDSAWERARTRMAIIGPLVELEVVDHQAADAAAHALGLSRRQIYVLIQRARRGTGW